MQRGRYSIKRFLPIESQVVAEILVAYFDQLDLLKAQKSSGYAHARLALSAKCSGDPPSSTEESI